MFGAPKPVSDVWLSNTRRHEFARDALLIAAIAAVYFCTGKLGLRLAFLNQSATAVWPPTGISLAAVLLFGRRIWPGIWLGAFLVNITITPMLVTLGITTGNTLEPLLGAWLVERFAHGRHAFRRTRDMLLFVVLAAVIGTAVSATFGLVSLNLGGFVSLEKRLAVWMTWWSGDLVSAVILAPLILVWSTIPLQWTRGRVFELLMLLLSLSVLGLVLFGGSLHPLPNHEAWLFLCFPSLLWSAYRFGPHGAITASTVFCALAIWGAMHGLGLVVQDNPNTSLVLLQAFMATITLTNLVLGCVTAERREVELALRASEAAARASESRKGAIVESALDCIVSMDAKGQIVDFNPAAERTFGFRRANVIGRTVAETIIPPRLREAHWQGLRNYGLTGEHRLLGRRIELSALHSSGVEFPVELAITATPIGTRPVLFTAYLRDISERKREERRHALQTVIAQVLAESATPDEALTRILQAVCETLGHWCTSAIWTVDRESQVLRCRHFWNSPQLAVSKFAAVTRERTFQKNVGLPGRVWGSGRPVWIADVVQDDNFPRAPLAAEEGMHAAFGFPIIMGGEIFGVMEFFSQAVEQPDEAVLSIAAEVGLHIGQFLDRKRSDEAQRVSRQELQLITDAMSAPVTRGSRDLKYLWVNRSFADLVGRPHHEIVGRPIIDVIGRQAFDHLKPYIVRVLAGETVSYEEQVVLGSRGPRWIGAVYSPTSDALGQVDGWVAVFIDLDDRVKAEMALQEADRRKDEFLAILAHELRNPLAPVRTAVALLGKIAEGSSEVLELREMIDRQVTQMTRLLDDLLDVSRITSGKINIRRERVSLNTVINTALESSRPLIEAQAHTLSMELPVDPVYLEADLTRLAQVFSNLLNNAAKYTDRGGRIWLTAEIVSDGVVVRIRDNGIGIPAAMLPHVFDMFVQVEGALERTHGGLGIGLTLVKRLVEMHGGLVEVRSEGPGKGSEFIVRLPGVSIHREAPSEPHGKRRSAAEGPKYRVLIADDNVDSAELLARLLVMLGHQTLIVHDGLEAVAAAKSFRPDAALLDIGMPRLNGYEVARRIRCDPACGSMRLIAMTGWGQEEDKRRAMEAGFDHHLTKPMEISAIEQILSTTPAQD